MDYINKYIESNNLGTILSYGVPIANHLCPISYSPNGFYDHRYFLMCLLEFVKKNVHWSDYIGPPDPIKGRRISGKYLNQIHNNYVRCGVYEEINRNLLNKYLQQGKEDKLKYQIIDSSFIQNKRGSTKSGKNNNHLSARDKLYNIEARKYNNSLRKGEQRCRSKRFIDFNRYNGRKKYFKVSLITNQYGIPLGFALIASKHSDTISIEETVVKLFTNLNTKRNSKINRYKQHMLADALYDSKKNRILLEKLGYIPIICPNRRRLKNEKKLRKLELHVEDTKDIYAKRKIIESSFAWAKNYAIINQCYEKTITSYNGLFSLVASIIISKNI